MAEVGERKTKRRCRWCGGQFYVVPGEARRRGCPDCEPPLIERAETVRPARHVPPLVLEQRAPSPT